MAPAAGGPARRPRGAALSAPRSTVAGGRARRRGLAAAAIVGGALGAARRHPRAAWIVAVGALLASAPTAAPTLGLATCSPPRTPSAPVAARARWAGVAALAALDRRARSSASLIADDDGAVPALLIPAAGWAPGARCASASSSPAQLAERARELEEEREAHAALSVRYERARIASELHDIVAHAISVMVVQASAGQRLAAHDPAADRRDVRGDRRRRPPGRAGHGAPGGAARRRARDRRRRPT